MSPGLFGQLQNFNRKSYDLFSQRQQGYLCRDRIQSENYPTIRINDRVGSSLSDIIKGHDRKPRHAKRCLLQYEMRQLYHQDNGLSQQAVLLPVELRRSQKTISRVLKGKMGL